MVEFSSMGPELYDLQTSPWRRLFLYKAMDTFESRIASRLQASTNCGNTILLQTKSTDLLSPFLRAAWLRGWRAAVLNADFPAGQVPAITRRLGPCLHVQSVGRDQVIISDGSGSKDLATWLTGARQETVAPYQWREDACALILFTSGSTGEPKGVCHSFGNILRSAQLFVDHFSLTKEDTLFCLAPVHTMSGLRSVAIPFFCDRTVIFPTADTFLQLVMEIAACLASHILCGPVFVRQLAAYGARILDCLQKVKAILCTGADLGEGDREQVQNTLNIPVLNYYGLTETSGIVLAEKPRQQLPDCLPPPCAGVEIVTSPFGGPNEVQRLIIRSPNLFLGYLGEEPARRTTFDTGDLVGTTVHGHLQLQGRVAGTVKGPSTEWLHPLLLEKWLKRHCSLPDCHVAPILTDGGYRLRVSVNSAGPLPTEALDNRIYKELGPDYVPVSWELVRLERNPLGKLVHITPLNQV